MALMVEVMPSEKNQMGFAAIDLSFVSYSWDFFKLLMVFPSFNFLNLHLCDQLFFFGDLE